jgi:hypothetical protein
MKWLRFLAVCIPGLVAACSSSPSPLVSEPARPGADQAAPATTTLPSASASRQYDPGISAENPERGMKIGAVVAPTGGQKAQQEKAKKEQAALEAQQDKERQDQARQESPDQKTSQ